MKNKLGCFSLRLKGVGSWIDNIAYGFQCKSVPIPSEVSVDFSALLLMTEIFFSLGE